MPTGIAFHDARNLLFDAAERVLVRDGASALTSRAVTTEAGVAKGVMHRHFADFDTFVAELVLDRAAQVEGYACALLDAAGTRTVADNLADALRSLFGPIAVAMVGLIISRDGLRTRLRRSGAQRLPIIAEGTAMISAYLAAERDLHRIAPAADVRILAPTLMGAAHMLFTDREGPLPTRITVRRMVETVLAGATPFPGAP